jgi:hypothetical protein
MMTSDCPRHQVLFLAPTELMARNETFPQLETLTVSRPEPP